MKNINKKLLTDSMLEKLEVEENKSRMNFFEIDHIKSEDKKLLKLVSEQHKLIRFLEEYYLETCEEIIPPDCYPIYDILK